MRVGLALLCGSAAWSGCSRSGPGGEIAIGADEAAAALALASGEDGSRVDFADAVNNAPNLEHACEFATLRREVIVRYDRDGDGELDAAELATLRKDFGGKPPRGQVRNVARLERIKWLRWVYDANADRKLDLDEWRALKHDLDARCRNHAAELVQRFDQNRDGRLDDVEWTAAREALAARFAQQHARVLAQFDVDHDGRLSARERAAALERMRQRIDARWEMLVDRFDADRNGVLDVRERSAAREYQRSVVRDERTLAIPPGGTAAGTGARLDDAGAELETRGGA
jgi:Ca2+-binding EF-hand superfamily protein